MKPWFWLHNSRSVATKAWHKGRSPSGRRVEVRRWGRRDSMSPAPALSVIGVVLVRGEERDRR